MEIKYLKSFQAVKAVRNLNIEDMIIREWFHDKGKQCYIYYVNGNPASFILLSIKNELRSTTNPEKSKESQLYLHVASISKQKSGYSIDQSCEGRN